MILANGFKPCLKPILQSPYLCVLTHIQTHTHVYSRMHAPHHLSHLLEWDLSDQPPPHSLPTQGSQPGKRKMSRVVFLLSQSSVRGRHIWHAQPGDFGAGLWGLPASVLNRLSHFESGRESSNRLCRAAILVVSCTSSPSLLHGPCLALGSLIPILISHPLCEVGVGEEKCQVFVVRKIWQS